MVQEHPALPRAPGKRSHHMRARPEKSRHPSMGVAERRMVWENKGYGWGVLFGQHRQAGAGRCGATGLGGTVGAMAWWLTPEIWRWAVSLEWPCHVEIAGTAPKVKPSPANPNWEHPQVSVEGSGEQGMMSGSYQAVPASSSHTGLKTC